MLILTTDDPTSRKDEMDDLLNALEKDSSIFNLMMEAANFALSDNIVDPDHPHPLVVSISQKMQATGWKF